jgi:hypothetical protein
MNIWKKYKIIKLFKNNIKVWCAGNEEQLKRYIMLGKYNDKELPYSQLIST